MTQAMAQPGALDRPLPRIHWTARASLYLSLFLYLVLPLVLAIPQFLGGPIFNTLGIYFITGQYLALYLPVPALVLSVVALVIAFRSPWRRGLEFALIGLGLNGLLSLQSILSAWMVSCCLHHVHIVIS